MKGESGLYATDFFQNYFGSNKQNIKYKKYYEFRVDDYGY